MALQILTANRLTDGCVVWYTDDGAWVEKAARAMVAQDDETKAILKAAAQAAIAANLVVEAELIDVENREGQFYALRLRERIRENGPSIAYGLNARDYEKNKGGKPDVSL